MKLKFENPKRYNFKELEIGTSLLLEEALQRGIKVSKDIGDFRILEYKKKRHIVRAHEIDIVGRPSVRVTNDKQVCKDFLSLVGLSVPKGKVFERDELKKGLAYFHKLRDKVVCKPACSDYGDDVFLDIDSPKKLKKIFRKLKKKEEKILLEEQFSGKEEARIFVTEKGYVCAVSRYSANVVGDGKHTIKELVDIKNKEKSKQWKKRKENIEKYFLKFDKYEKSVIKKQGCKAKSIPEKGTRVFLRKNSNLSTGGDSIDITSELHPSVKKIAIKVLEAIPRLRYAGIDIITKTSFSRLQKPKDYKIIEVNNIPGIFGHHLPYRGEKRNPAGAILDLMFPGSKK